MRKKCTNRNRIQKREGRGEKHRVILGKENWKEVVRGEGDLYANQGLPYWYHWVYDTIPPIPNRYTVLYHTDSRYTSLSHTILHANTVIGYQYGIRYWDCESWLRPWFFMEYVINYSGMELSLFWQYNLWKLQVMKSSAIWPSLSIHWCIYHVMIFLKLLIRMKKNAFYFANKLMMITRAHHKFGKWKKGQVLKQFQV